MEGDIFFYICDTFISRSYGISLAIYNIGKYFYNLWSDNVEEVVYLSKFIFFLTFVYVASYFYVCIPAGRTRSVLNFLLKTLKTLHHLLSFDESLDMFIYSICFCMLSHLL